MKLHVLFKKTRYILMSSRKTLQRKDKDASKQKKLCQRAALFLVPRITFAKVDLKNVMMIYSIKQAAVYTGSYQGTSHSCILT